MKRIIFLLVCSIISIIGTAQHADTLHRAPQRVELTISTPQPRLGETFAVSIDIQHLRAAIFRQLKEKVRPSSEFTGGNAELMSMEVQALQKGMNEIGPLEFTVDNFTYITNKVTYEVVDPLPDTDKGLWFRVVRDSESIFYIIIEQRIPASKKATYDDDETTITTEPEHNDIARFKDDYSIKGAGSSSSHSRTSFSSVEINGESRQFLFGQSVYRFKISDRSSKIKITKDLFENIPPDHNFEEIIIQ